MDWNSRRITAILENALTEDNATRDATTAVCIHPGQKAEGTIRARQECILAGVGAIARIFEVFAQLEGGVGMESRANISVNPEVFDGVRLKAGSTVAVIRHEARVILSCERVVLNVLQRLRGIA